MAFKVNNKALELADSYLQEVMAHVDSPDLRSNAPVARELMRTLDSALKNLRIAEEELGENPEVGPARAMALALKGWVTYVGLDQRAQGIRLLNQAIDSDNENGPAHAMIAHIYAASGDKETALRHYSRAVEIDPNEIEWQKALDRLEDTPSTGLTLASFQGSWKVVIVLAVITLWMFGVGSVVPALFFLACLIGYWLIKTRM